MTVLQWAAGTACDLFMSLFVLNHAGDFGIRPAWAAGVRQRLTQPKREFIERVYSFASVPLQWISHLPSPRTAQVALQEVASLPPAERLPVLTIPPDLLARAQTLLEGVSSRRRWTPEEKNELIACYGPVPKPSPAGVEALLDAWTALEENGQKYLDALQEYFSVFFGEEEARIQPALESSLLEAQNLATQLPVVELVEQLSRGVRLENVETVSELTLLPSWWVSPLTFLMRSEKGKVSIAYGTRSEILGETEGAEPTDTLVNALKSLADPTRLRILRFLANEHLTPSELARRLRLRPPTVIHHLRNLRLANLVQVTVGENMERLYAARLEALHTIQKSLDDFLNIDG